MLRILHVQTLRPHLLLNAPAAKLESVRSLILQVAKGNRIEFSVLSDAGYRGTRNGRSLARLTVRAGEGPCRVFVEADTVVATGGREGLVRFASCFDFSGVWSNTTQSSHAYRDGETKVDPTSVPLVISTDPWNPADPGERTERYKRPWYHLHFVPWCLMLLGFALYLYTVITIQDRSDAIFEYMVTLFLGSGCLVGAAFLEAKYQWEENLEKIEQERNRRTPEP